MTGRERPWRVLYVLPPNVLGSQFYRGLHRYHDPSRVELAFASLKGPETAPAEPDGEPLASTGLGMHRIHDLPAAALRLARLVRKSKVDVVHGHLFWPSTVGLLGGRLGRVSQIMTSRLYSDLLLKEGRRRRVRIEGWVHSRMDTVISVSQFMTRYLTETERVPADRIRTIYLGIHLDNFQTPDPSATASFRKPHGGEEAFLVGCAGRLVAEKGFENALRAFAPLAQRDPRARLLIAGEGPLEAHLRQTAKRLGLGQRVAFLGQLPLPRLLQFYDAIDVFLHTSISEGLGQVTLEAMTMGRPCVAFDVGPMPECIDNGTTGFLVPEGDVAALTDRLALLHGDAHLRRRMGDAGRKRVEERFDIRTIVKQHEALYDDLLAR